MYKGCAAAMTEHPPPSPPSFTSARCPFPPATRRYEPPSPARSFPPMHPPAHVHRPAPGCAAAATIAASCPCGPCVPDDETAACSYCGECATHPFDPLVVVCACKTRPVHASCLHRWVRARPQTGAARFLCEVCGCAYMDGRPEFAAWLLAVGVWGGVKRWWDEAVAAVVGGSTAEGEGRGGRMTADDDDQHNHAPDCARVTKDKMSASTSSVTTHTLHH